MQTGYDGKGFGDQVREMARKERIEAKSLVWQNRLKRKRKRPSKLEQSQDQPVITVDTVDPTPAGAASKIPQFISDQLSHSIGTPDNGRRDVYLDDIEQRETFDNLARRSRTYVDRERANESNVDQVGYDRISPITTEV